ncbi:MAG: hypothetical protein U0N86_01610, partial [Lachnospiraceae bacterium]
LVERCVRDAEVASSNLVASTKNGIVLMNGPIFVGTTRFELAGNERQYFFSSNDVLKYTIRRCFLF